MIYRPSCSLNHVTRPISADLSAAHAGVAGGLSIILPTTADRESVRLRCSPRQLTAALDHGFAVFVLVGSAYEKARQQTALLQGLPRFLSMPCASKLRLGRVSVSSQAIFGIGLLWNFVWDLYIFE